MIWMNSEFEELFLYNIYKLEISLDIKIRYFCLDFNDSIIHIFSDDGKFCKIRF